MHHLSTSTHSSFHAAAREQHARREYRSLQVNRSEISDAEYDAKIYSLVELIGLRNDHMQASPLDTDTDGLAADEADDSVVPDTEQEATSLWQRKKAEIESRQRARGDYIRRLDKMILAGKYDIMEPVKVKGNCFSALASNRSFAKNGSLGVVTQEPAPDGGRDTSIYSVQRYPTDPQVRTKMCYLCHRLVVPGWGLVACATCPLVSHEHCFIDISGYYDNSSNSSSSRVCAFCHAEMISHNRHVVGKYRLQVSSYRRERAVRVIQRFLRMAAVRGLFLMIRRSFQRLQRKFRSKLFWRKRRLEAINDICSFRVLLSDINLYFSADPLSNLLAKSTMDREVSAHAASAAPRVIRETPVAIIERGLLVSAAANIASPANSKNKEVINNLYKLRTLPEVVQDLQYQTASFADLNRSSGGGGALADGDEAAGDGPILRILAFHPTYMDYLFDGNKKSLLERSQLVLTVSVCLPAGLSGSSQQLFRLDFPLALDKDGLLCFDTPCELLRELGLGSDAESGLGSELSSHAMSHYQYGRFVLPNKSRSGTILVPFATCHSALRLTISRIIDYPHCDALGEVELDISSLLYNKKCLMQRAPISMVIGSSPSFFDSCELDIRRQRDSPSPRQQHHHTLPTAAYTAQKAPRALHRETDVRSIRDVLVGGRLTVAVLPISRENYNFSGTILLLPGGDAAARSRHYAVLIDGLLMIYKFPGARVDINPVRVMTVGKGVSLSRHEARTGPTSANHAGNSKNSNSNSKDCNDVDAFDTKSNSQSSTSGAAGTFLYIRIRDKNGPLWLSSSRGDGETADWWQHLAQLAGIKTI